MSGITADGKDKLLEQEKRRKTVAVGARSLLRELWWIILLGMAVQAFWALRLDHPAYFDAYYYTTNARRLATGQGFTEEIVWQYLDEPQSLPTPSHTYWMPLPSIIGAMGYWLGGSFRAAQLPFWLMAALLPLLSYVISWRLFRRRWQARTAALFTMTGGYYSAYWIQPSTFVLFAWVGGGCLLALALAREKGTLFYWLLGGVAAGLAHLTRADGVLFLVVGGLLWLVAARDRWDKRRPPLHAAPMPQARSRPLAAAILFVVGYLLIMSPWLYRTWRLTGEPLSTVGTQTIFLTVYDDVFAYGRQFGLAGYLNWGWRNILGSKLDALWLALQTYVAVVGLTAFSFFVVAGWIVSWRREDARRFLQPFTWYALLLFVAMSLVFTFPGQRGSLLHSSSALWPWSMALVPGGVDRAVDWVAARRRRWQPRAAKRFFAVTFVFLAFAISAAVAAPQPLREKEAAVYEEIGTMLPEDAVVMAGNPPGLHYHSELSAVAIPNEPAPRMLQAAQQFGAGYLLLSSDYPRPLKGLYEGVESGVTIELVRDFGNGVRLYRLPQVK